MPVDKNNYSAEMKINLCTFSKCQMTNDFQVFTICADMTAKYAVHLV